MLSDPIRIADAINNPRFHPGDEVVLAEGPHKYVHGIFLRLKEDVEWAAIKEANGAISSHPVEWMSTYTGPLSYIAPQKEERKSDFMRKLGSIITLAVVSAALVYAAKRFPLTAASIVPAAKGSVEIGTDGNGNTEVKLKVEHLANP